MGMRGPPPTPTPILKARGSRRAEDRSGEVQYERGRPTCPTWLGVEARAEWGRQVKQLDAAGILQKVDRAALACWCEAWGEFRGIVEEIERILTPSPDAQEAAVASAAPDPSRPTGYALAVATGLVNAKNRAVQRLLQLAGQFGFTPAARVRIKGPARQADDGTGKLRYFDGE
jgi:P27 family predicted phage terminase small subunit